MDHYNSVGGFTNERLMQPLPSDYSHPPGALGHRASLAEPHAGRVCPVVCTRCSLASSRPVPVVRVSLLLGDPTERASSGQSTHETYG